MDCGTMPPKRKTGGRSAKSSPTMLTFGFTPSRSTLYCNPDLVVFTPSFLAFSSRYLSPAGHGRRQVVNTYANRPMATARVQPRANNPQSTNALRAAGLYSTRPRAWGPCISPLACGGSSALGQRQGQHQHERHTNTPRHLESRARGLAKQTNAPSHKGPRLLGLIHVLSKRTRLYASAVI